MKEKLISDNLPLEIAQVCYTTESLVKLFRSLNREGYEALSLGLIIDLIGRDANAVR
jgi:hypothetical protein